MDEKGSIWTGLVSCPFHAIKTKIGYNCHHVCLPTCQPRAILGGSQEHWNLQAASGIDPHHQGELEDGGTKWCGANHLLHARPNALCGQTLFVQGGQPLV